MADTREHRHREPFAQSPTVVFQLLHQPSAIRRWWGASQAIVIPRRGGVWAATWGEDEDDADYITTATIRDFEPPHRLVLSDFHYHARGGPLPFDADFETEFVVTENNNGCELTVTQRGFPAGPESDEYFAACQKGWTDTFAGIRRYLDDKAT